MPVYVWDPRSRSPELATRLNAICPPCESVSLRVETAKAGFVVVLPDLTAVVITDLGPPVEIVPGGLALFQNKLGLLKAESTVHIAATRWVMGTDVEILVGEMKRTNGSLICNFCLLRWMALMPNLIRGNVEAVDSLASLLALPTDCERVFYSAAAMHRRNPEEDFDTSGNRYIAMLLVRALQTRL